MQPASASDMRPAISLLEKTLRLSALARECIRSLETSPSPKCSTNGPTMISDISDKSPNSIARARFIHIQVPL